MLQKLDINIFIHDNFFAVCCYTVLQHYYRRCLECPEPDGP